MTISRVVSCGGYLPKNLKTNRDLENVVDTSDEWIQQRTGIQQRHFVSENETTSDIAYAAALDALKNANCEAADVDLIILATTTPDHPFPATATRVQHKLGAKNAFAFDVQAVCSGFVYALATADNYIKSGMAKTALVIGADTMSKLLDFNDRATCVLFGDGAAAYVLKADEEATEYGIHSNHLFSDGEHYEALYVDSEKGAKVNLRGFVHMNGRLIYKHAVNNIGAAIEAALKANNKTVDDIDWLIPHQANKRIIESVAKNFNLPMEKVVSTIEMHANTSAASIPLATYELWKQGKLKAGQKVILESMGGGLTWASSYLVWG